MMIGRVLQVFFKTIIYCILTAAFRSNIVTFHGKSYLYEIADVQNKPYIYLIKKTRLSINPVTSRTEFSCFMTFLLFNINLKRIWEMPLKVKLWISALN